MIALALLVLLIMAVLITHQTQNAQKTINNCQSIYQGTCIGANECASRGGTAVQGGTCSASATYQQQDNWVVYSYPAGGTVCCVTK